MDFWFIVLAVVGFFVIFPFIRLFLKRVSLFIKIKRACKKSGARLIKAHPLWFFGGRRGKKCDFHIETENNIVSVKLFQMLRHSSMLHFTENSQYYCEHCIIMLFGRFGGSHSITAKTKPRLLPSYDFSFKAPESDKPQKKLLLVNPVCSAFFIHSRENGNGQGTADFGDIIGDTELYALKPLIKLINE